MDNEQTGRSTKKLKKVINWLTKHRNLLFLSVCLLIHAIFAVLFSVLDIWLIALINLLSCSFYAYFLFLEKDTSEKSMAATYFEIILFAVLNEILLGPKFGFYLYIVGMAATIFFLVPSYGNKRFIYEIIGIVTALIVESIVMLSGIDFPSIRDPAETVRIPVYLCNILITACIVLGTTFFYSKETEQVWETLRYNMNHDVLTGLYNRRYFEQRIESISDSQISQYVIAMVDIDFFKKVNDTYGHEAGDAVLAEVAACLKETANGSNLAVRWGGEEFILYFPKAKPEQIHPVMEALRQRIENMVIPSAEHMICVTITVGIATGMTYKNYEKVIKSADEKLYLGKQRGRNRVVI